VVTPPPKVAKRTRISLVEVIVVLVIIVLAGGFMWVYAFQDVFNPPILKEAKRWIGKPESQLRRKLGAPMEEYTRAQIDKREVDFPPSTYTKPDYLPPHRVLVYHGLPGPNLVLVYVNANGIVSDVLMIST
jgi:hypothetical protein